MGKHMHAKDAGPSAIVGDIRLQSGQIVLGFKLQPGTANRTLAEAMPGAVWVTAPKAESARIKIPPMNIAPDVIRGIASEMAQSAACHARSSRAELDASWDRAAAAVDD